MSAPSDVVVISSLVARGGIGGRATAFALERLGFRTWFVPTVTLPHHPGWGPVSLQIPERAAFAAMLEALERAEWLSGVRAIVTGYFADPAQVELAAAFVDMARATAPDLIYLCDPVMGDASAVEEAGSGRLYVANAIAEAIRDELIIRADISTPNAFEAGWLTGVAPDDLNDLAAACRSIAGTATLVTGLNGLMRGSIAACLVEKDKALTVEHRSRRTGIKGTGDVLSGLFLGRILQERSLDDAAQLATAATLDVLDQALAAHQDELDLAKAQDSLVHPRAQLAVRQLKLPPIL